MSTRPQRCTQKIFLHLIVKKRLLQLMLHKIITEKVAQIGFFLYN